MKDTKLSESKVASFKVITEMLIEDFGLFPPEWWLEKFPPESDV